MNRIVVYTSKTGFTEKYAKWIAKALKCEAKSLTDVKLEELKNYDQVIYGGWIMAGRIRGYSRIHKLNIKNLVVFACGMTKPSEDLRKKIALDNGVDIESFFYFEGGYNPQKLGFISKFLLGFIKRSLEKKEDKTEDDYRILDTFKGADRTRPEYIDPLLEYCKRIH